MSTAMRIKNDELQVGHWIQFCTQQASVSERQKPTYRPNRHFLVISRQEPCCCHLIDIIRKNVHQYIASDNTLRRMKLTSDVEIRVLTRTAVESVHGSRKVGAIYLLAANYIQTNASFFSQVPMQLLYPLPPSNSKPSIKEEKHKEQQVEKQNGELLAAKAFCGNQDPELLAAAAFAQVCIIC